MKPRSPWLVLGVAAVVALFAILLLPGCESGTTMKTSATVDVGPRRATIEFHSTDGAYYIVALLLT